MNTLTLKKYDNEDEFNDLLKSSPKKKPKNQSHFKDKEWESLEALTSNQKKSAIGGGLEELLNDNDTGTAGVIITNQSP